MSSQPTVVLDHAAIEAKVERMAWQIYEEFSGESQILMAGIAERGYQLAEKLSAVLRTISPLEIDLRRLLVDKENPLRQAVQLEPAGEDFAHCPVVVVDDVLKSGSTLIYGVHFFLNYPLKSLKTAVLVDRNHKRYPVKADFKGLSLSTSWQEHVQVHFQGEASRVEVS